MSCIKHYNRRTWLNPESSSSTSAIITFDGKYINEDGKEDDWRFVELKDCKRTVTFMQHTDEDTKEDFVNKIKLIRDELDLYLDYLKNN